MRRPIWVAAVVAVLACVGCAQIALPRPPARTYEKPPKLVLAHYYPWYSPPWNPTPDHPIYGAYDSGDPALITWHFELAENAGVDGFISSWWGRGSPTDNVFRSMLDIAEAIGTRVRLTIHYEKIPPNGKAGVIDDLKAILENYGNREPFLTALGSPVIFIYSRAVRELSPSQWERVFGELRDNGYDALFIGEWVPGVTKPFDGIHVYNPLGSWNSGFSPRMLELWFTGFYRLIRIDGILVATVVPGYDDTLVPGRDGFAFPRYEGETYDAMWRAAMGSGADWISITSWNEWWEGTEIEPSVEYGCAYLEATREYVSMFEG